MSMRCRSFMVMLGASGLWLLGDAGAQDSGSASGKLQAPAVQCKDAGQKDGGLGLLQGTPIKPVDWKGFPEMIPFKEVECRLGRGAQTEGPVTVYPSAGEKGVDYWFWFMPIDTRSKQPWSFDNCGLYLITSGGDGPILWPEKLKGRSLKAVFEEYSRQHPELRQEAVTPPLAADRMDTIVAKAARSGRKLLRTPGQDEKCQDEPGKPRFYSYAGTEPSDNEVVRQLMKLCDAIGPHRGMNIANWCCP